MRLEDEGDRLLFRGRFEITDESVILEAFAVELELAPDSPRGIPRAWEVGGRIPRVADPHHVNDADGSLCVVLPEAYWYQWPGGLSLSEFLVEPMRAHLAGQACVLRGEPWPGGEWLHGDAGVLQFYGEVLGAPTRHVLQELLKTAANPAMKQRWWCPCGCGKRLRDCHGPILERLRQLPTFHRVQHTFSAAWATGSTKKKARR